MGTFLVILFVVIFIIALVNTSKKVSAQNDNFRKDGMDPNKFIAAGKYISGHTNLNTPFENASIYPKGEVVKIFKLNPDGTRAFAANITTSLIKDIAVEDESTIQSRVGLKRLIALGIFAFALKKKEKKELAYLIIEWDQGQFKNETVFEFQGTNAITRANTARNKLVNEISGIVQDNTELDIQLLQYIEAGATLQAVKTYHDTTGATLKESKDYVDALKLKFQN